MTIDIEDIKEYIQKYTYEHGTDMATDIIKNRSSGSTYAYDIWQDGEINGTKGGDLYGHRIFHTMSNPIGVKLFDISKSKSRIIDPDSIEDLEILMNTYRDENKIVCYVKDGEWKYINK